MTSKSGKLNGLNTFKNRLTFHVEAAYTSSTNGGSDAAITDSSYY